MNKLFNKAVLNGTTIMGDGLTYPRIPNVYTGDNEGGYQRGDMMDANAVVEMIKELTDTGKITIDELKNLINEEIQERVEGDQDQQRYTDEKIKDLIGTSPETLDTLKEIADALGEDPDFAANVWEKLAEVDQTLEDYKRASNLPKYVVSEGMFSPIVFKQTSNGINLNIYRTDLDTGDTRSKEISNAIPEATKSMPGIMSAKDKRRMGLIPDDLVNYIIVESFPSQIGIRYGRKNLIDESFSDMMEYIPSATQSKAGVISSSDKTKLDGIEAGAQVNKIESVSVNGTPLDITNKGVNIPIHEYTAGDGIKLENGKFSLDTIEHTERSYTTKLIGPKEEPALNIPIVDESGKLNKNILIPNVADLSNRTPTEWTGEIDDLGCIRYEDYKNISDYYYDFTKNIFFYPIRDNQLLMYNIGKGIDNDKLGDFLKNPDNYNNWNIPAAIYLSDGLLFDGGLYGEVPIDDPKDDSKVHYPGGVFGFKVNIDKSKNNLLTFTEGEEYTDNFSGVIANTKKLIVPKQSVIDTIVNSNEFNAKQDALTEAQLNNINNAITSISVNGVEQINTNGTINLTIPNATPSKAGLMSASDKTKLNSPINYYYRDLGVDTKLTDFSNNICYVGSPVLEILGNKVKFEGAKLCTLNGIPFIDCSVPKAVASLLDGLMSKEDKAKLDSQPTIKASDATGVTDDDYVVIKKSEYQSILDRLSALENKA